MTRIAILFGSLAHTLLGLATAQPVGSEFYRDLASLPKLYPNVESYYLSSYDRSGGNDDGFRGTYSQLYVDDKGEHVIFDSRGPGCIYNFWFTGTNQDLHWGKIRFYFDGEEEPRFESEARELFRGDKPPFLYPLVTHSFISSGGFSCSAPIPFSEHLKITTEKTAGFYNIYYQLYGGLAVDSWTPEYDYSRVVSLFERCGSDPKVVADKITVVTSHASLGKANRESNPDRELLALGQGGVVQYIKVNPLFAPDTYCLNHLYLQIFYDNDEKPAVDVPIGPFFGSGLGEADVRSLLVGMSTSGTYYCYLPIPFRDGIRILLKNRSHEAGAELFCEIGYSNGFPESGPDAPVGYLGAHYNSEWPIVEERDYTLFDHSGTGAVVGQVMTVEPVKPDRKRWWEGDMRIFIDGENSPRFHGTGHEDEYQGGWSTFWLTNPYSLPLFGEPKTQDLIDVYGQINGSTTAYRFWPGKVPFKKAITVSTEHGNNNDTPANYSSLVYYYYLPNDLRESP